MFVSTAIKISISMHEKLKYFQIVLSRFQLHFIPWRRWFHLRVVLKLHLVSKILIQINKLLVHGETVCEPEGLGVSKERWLLFIFFVLSSHGPSSWNRVGKIVGYILVQKFHKLVLTSLRDSLDYVDFVGSEIKSITHPLDSWFSQDPLC